MLNWFKNLTVGQKINGLVGLMLVFMCIIASVGYYYTVKAGNDMKMIYTDALLPVKWLNENRNYNRAIEGQILLLQFSDNEEELQKHIDKIYEELSKLEKNMSDYAKIKLDSEEIKTLKIYGALVPKYKETLDNAVNMAKEGQFRKLTAYFKDNEVKDTFVNMATILRDLAKYSADEAQNINEQNARDTQIATVVVITISLMSVVIALLSGLFISGLITGSVKKMISAIARDAKGNINVKQVEIDSADEIGQMAKALNDLTSQVKAFVNEVAKSVEEVTSGSEELSASAEQTAQGAQQTAVSVAQLAQGSQEQANGVTRSVSNLNKMNQVVQKINQNADNVVAMSSSAEDGAKKGFGEAQKAVNKINQIKQTATETAKTANKLGDLGKEIEQIVDLIKNIASQTNLLALNAAIEAARAGEHGKGFAVVADEVKKLAGESADATDKITGIVKQVQSMTHNVVSDMDKGVKEIDEGVVTIENVGTVLKEILSVAQNVNRQAEEVSQVSNNLVRDSQEVLGVMEGISAITEETAAQAEEMSSITEEQTASLEEISAGSQTLAKVAENLQKQVAMFTI